eukprot:scaffold620589_cov43-Prasinocladus_malaysianus.AAC.1
MTSELGNTNTRTGRIYEVLRQTSCLTSETYVSTVVPRTAPCQHENGYEYEYEYLLAPLGIAGVVQSRFGNCTVLVEVL